MIDFVCDLCGKKLRAEDTHVGKKVQCPECKAMVEIKPVAATPPQDENATPELTCDSCGLKLRAEALGSS